MVFVPVVAFLADFRTQCTRFGVSVLGGWRLPGPSHSGFASAPFLLRCGVLPTSIVFRVGFVGPDFDVLLTVLVVGEVLRFLAHRGRFLAVSFHSLSSDYGFGCGMRLATSSASIWRCFSHSRRPGVLSCLVNVSCVSFFSYLFHFGFVVL